MFQFNLSVVQVDRLVALLIPITLNNMLYCKHEQHLPKVLLTIRRLARMRPRMVWPRLLDRLEEGLVMTEAPLRYSRPLYALTHSIRSLVHMDFPLYIGVSEEHKVDYFDVEPDEHTAEDLDDTLPESDSGVAEQQQGQQEQANGDRLVDADSLNTVPRVNSSENDLMIDGLLPHIVETGTTVSETPEMERKVCVSYGGCVVMILYCSGVFALTLLYAGYLTEWGRVAGLTATQR